MARDVVTAAAVSKASQQEVVLAEEICRLAPFYFGDLTSRLQHDARAEGATEGTWEDSTSSDEPSAAARQKSVARPSRGRHR